MTQKYDLDSRDPVSSDFAYDTFSKAGFKPVSSICEIIDNSIEAESNEVFIEFEWNDAPHHLSYKQIKKFVFIDNGKGMNENQIYDYFVATESDKRGKENGIGKFGVGAYMSGISQAARCEVFSKTDSGKWLYTNLIKGSKIPKPINRDPPEEYLKFNKGTVVIWSETYSPFTINDVDNEETGDNLVFQLGRIYRKFLTDQKIHKGEKITNKNKIKIQIKSDGTIIDVKPFDPTFITYNPKTGDDEPEMISMGEIQIKTPAKTGSMYIVFSAFPEDWWIKPGKPGLLDVNRKERKITQPGISLIREDRELYYGSYPGGPVRIQGSKNGQTILADTDRWLGIEVSFEKDSDDIFGVEFNKTRIIMEKVARDRISDVISPTVNTFRQKYETRRSEYNAKIGGTTTTGGKGGTSTIQGQLPPIKHTSEEEKRIRAFAEMYKDDLESIDDVYQDLLKGFHVSLKYKLSPRGPFVEFATIGNSVMVMYNMQHPFIAQFFYILEKVGLKLGAQPGKSMAIPELESIRSLFDIVMASFGFAQTTFKDITKHQIVEETIMQLTDAWGRSANTLSKETLEDKSNDT